MPPPKKSSAGSKPSGDSEKTALLTADGSIIPSESIPDPEKDIILQFAPAKRTPWTDLERLLLPPKPEHEKKKKNKCVSIFSSLAPAGQPGSCRYQLGHLLETTTAHVLVVVFILLDMLVVLTGAVLEEHETQTETMEYAEEVLRYTSATILCAFCLELLLLMTAFGWKFFFHPGYLLDLVIVPTSLALELTVSEAAGFLVILRMWRFLRISHGVFELVHDRAEKKAEHERKLALHKFYECRDAYERSKKELSQTKKELELSKVQK